MKYFTFSLALFFFIGLFNSALGQTEAPEAPLKVVVTDFSHVAQAGEQVWFVSQTTKKAFKGVTGKDGSFQIKIPGAAVYDIKIKSIGEAEQNSTFEIPKLGPNQQYAESTLTIQFELPKTFTLDNIHFDTGKASLRSDSYKELNELVELLKLKPKLEIEIAGHTDDVGDDAANEKLSIARSNSVRAYLLKKGIQASRIISKGYGESQPVADNTTKEGRQLNRRIEVRILKS